jgi:tetratricopeptide (TPR) repeat protein
MYRYFGLIALIIFFVGCGKKIEIGEKSFEKEDEYIIKALVSKVHGDYNVSKYYVDLLYNFSNKNIYKKELIELNYLDKDYNKTIFLSKDYLQNYTIHDELVEKYFILSLFGLNKNREALYKSKILLSKNRTLQNYNFVAFSYLSMNDYENAIKYFKSMYAMNPSEIIVLKIGDILIKNLNNANEAISYYQTHIREHGCQKRVCLKMLAIYKFMYDTDNMIEVYKKLISKYENQEYKKELLNLYIVEKMYDKAISLVKKSNFPKELLLNLYEAKQDYKKASKLAYQLYKKTKAKSYLYKYAIYKFESSKKEDVDVEDLVNVLNKIVDELNSALAYNYLGYTLIDYDIDYKKGIELVKKALKLEVHNDYIDSLAWGYYKIKECKKAYQIIKQIKNTKSKEILKHIEKIKRCNDDIEKNNRKYEKKPKYKI